MSDEKKNNGTMTRTDVEKLLAPVVFEAVATIPNDEPHLRRALRALVHLGARRALALGVHPQTVVDSVGEALMKELHAFKKEQQAADPPAGPLAQA
jgi:hypothetical protein